MRVWFTLCWLLIALQNAPLRASEPSADPSLSDAQRWALSLSGPLSLTNSDDHDTLSGLPATSQARYSLQSTLAGWGVYDRRDLIERLERLASDGHSVRFAELAKRSAEDRAADYARALREYDAVALHRAELVETYGEKFGEVALAAWDYSRYVSLCRWGYASGYFTAEEAWEHILTAARNVQPLFSSWEEFAENYYVGYRFYSLKSWLDDAGSRYLYLQQLLHDPDSPWVELPWDTPLP